MVNRRNKPVVALASLCATLLAVACSPTSIEDPPDPLAALAPIGAVDSTGTPPPTGPLSPGSFRGFVVGYQQGPDSVQVRLPNVAISAYLRTGGVVAQQPTAKIKSGDNGEWQLPLLAAGEYAVAFLPESTSAYAGVWTMLTTSAASGSPTLWIMLPMK